MFYDIFYHSLEAYFFPHENDRGHHFGDWVHRYSSSWFYLWGYCSRGRHRHLLFSDAFPYSFEQFPASSCKIWLLNYYQDCTSTRITELKRPGRPMRDELIELIDENANFYQLRKTSILKNINVDKYIILDRGTQKMRKISILIWKSTLKTNSDLPHRQFMLNRRDFTFSPTRVLVAAPPQLFPKTSTCI